ncbi:MAG TPA: HDOD domain-containing protein [Steroidobacteraceae bacterium]|nr:HDOD domain-containing protein [Steroidobacteraceae bacterium]
MTLELRKSIPKPRIGDRPAPLDGDARALVDSLVLELAGEKIDLPSFPDVAMRVRKALTCDEVAIEDAVKIVSAEPALAARLMQLANSATLNPGGQRLNNLRAAMTRIGLNMACSVTIAFAMSQLRRAETYKGIESRLTGLWHEAAHLAAVSRVIARRFTSLNPDTALLAGLLQCIGKLYLLTRAARYPALLQDDEAFGRVISEYHLRVAQAILRNWDMDTEIVEAIGRCGDVKREHAGAIDLTDVLIVSAALISLGPDPQPQQISFPGMPAARRLGLDADTCIAALAESRDEIDALRQALNV